MQIHCYFTFVQWKFGPERWSNILKVKYILNKDENGNPIVFWTGHLPLWYIASLKLSLSACDKVCKLYWDNTKSEKFVFQKVIYW